MFSCEIDDSLAPLIIYRPVGKATDPAVTQHVLLDPLERNYHKYPFVVDVFDFTLQQVPTKEVRELVTAWITLQRPTIPKKCLAAAVAVPSWPMRWVLAGWWKIQPPPAQQYRTFATVPFALSWAADVLAERGTIVDPKKLRDKIESLEFAMQKAS